MRTPTSIVFTPISQKKLSGSEHRDYLSALEAIAQTPVPCTDRIKDGLNRASDTQLSHGIYRSESNTGKTSMAQSRGRHRCVSDTSSR